MTKISRAKKVKYIVIHCQAGNGTLESMQAFWKTLGWSSPGYSRWIDFDGTIHKLASFDENTNGVAGFNSQSIHFSYRGGIEVVEKKGKKVIVAKDTRTQAQKNALLKAILEAKEWLKENANDLQDVMILGHYHFSNDNNKNGAIESWERIKECPSFDAYNEYGYLMEVENPLYHKLKLPKNR